MPSFQDIGLREELLQALEDDEFATPTALQQAVIPTLRRGGNLVARTSSGSGKTLAYTLGILDRLTAEAGDEEEAESALKVLVLTPTTAEAEYVGETITRYAEPLGLRVTVSGSGWGTPPSEAAIVVAAAGDVMDAVRSSEIKLETLESIVIDGASAIVEIGHWEDVDSLMDLLPRDAQRILISSSLRDEVEDLAARRVKKALRYPSEAAIPEGLPTEPAGGVGYVLAADHEKLDLLAVQLRGKDDGSSPPIIFCRSDERAAELAERLALRGFLVGEPGDTDADVAIALAESTLEEIADEVDNDLGQTISFDVPADATTLKARHGGDEAGVVLVEPRELAHLREIARLASFTLKAAPLAGIDSRSSRELTTFRDEVRRVIQGEDITSQMLLIEPLLSEFSAVEVAAALAYLARRRASAAAVGEGGAVNSPSAKNRRDETGKGEPRGARERTSRPESPGPAPVSWVRLFVGIGSRDDVKPGDLVGGLAGEANIEGKRIGKIEIRDSFSIVEVQSDVADKVIQAVNGTTLKGRSVRVDYDRGGPARRPDNRGAAPRRTTRRPPR